MLFCNCPECFVFINRDAGIIFLIGCCCFRVLLFVVDTKYYTNETELNACLCALQDVYTFYEEKGFDDLVIGYTLHYQPPENNMDAEPDTEGKEYTGILSDIPTLSEFK